MKVSKIDNFQVKNTDYIKITEMGNITELMYMKNRNTSTVIKKINSEQYINIDTGEIKEYIHSENRSQNKNEVRRSLRRLREYINTNVQEVNKCLWVTLTYKENMTDTKKLYKDNEKFIKRLRYETKQNIQYIQAVEPQKRGAWHSHIIFIFEKNNPYISNNKLAKLWGNGFVKITKLDDIDNIGAYLTAYLGDIECKEDTEEKVKEVNGKKYIKGGRLCMYPPGINIYRCSRGIKKPQVSYKSEKNINKNELGKKTYEKTIEIDLERNNQVINYRYYNKGVKK